MGQLVYVYSTNTNEKHLNTLNKKLTSMGIKNSFTTRKDNKEWLNEINNDPNSQQSHLKPKDRNLEMDELIGMFSLFCEVGLMTFDVAFDRTSDDEAKKYVEFICEQENDLHLKNGDELIDRYTLTDNEKSIINKINILDEEPELLPLNEQYSPELQSGLFLCYSWGLKPFWVVFGNVETPSFLKVKKYKEPIYNSIYHDKNGYGYLLLPLMPIGDSEFIKKTYSDAMSMGLREHPHVFFPMVYHLEFLNPQETSKDFVNYYGDKLSDKYKQVYNMVYNENGKKGGLYWVDHKNEYGVNAFNFNKSSLMCLNALKDAMILSGKENKLIK